jgi:hypothetical protein
MHKLASYHYGSRNKELVRHHMLLILLKQFFETL